MGIAGLESGDVVGACWGFAEDGLSNFGCWADVLSLGDNTYCPS